MDNNSKKPVVDLRSDTVTHPTPEMRAAMAAAEVGDDQFGEDPSVNRLQKMAAEKLGKEAAVFVPSGTMGNLASILTHCNRGDEVILGGRSHVFLFEAGGISSAGSLHSCQVPNQLDGTIAMADLRAAIRVDNPHFPITRLIVLENTHNRCGGAALSVPYTREVGKFAKENGLLVHIDGARIFNAAIAQGVEARDLVAPVDSITFCLSKGLCCPVGSLILGSREFINRLIRIRTMLGGSMRQAGILAAAGIVALESMIDRLAEDHRRAKVLAEKIAAIPGLKLKFGPPQTNMVFVTLQDNVSMTAVEVADKLKVLNVKVGVVAARDFRLVTHYWIDDEGIDYAARAFAKVL